MLVIVYERVNSARFQDQIFFIKSEMVYAATLALNVSLILVVMIMNRWQYSGIFIIN